MVKCEDCKKEMKNKNVTSCSLKFRCLKFKVGKKEEIYPRDTTYFDWNDRCHDCGIENRVGNLHHFSCDVERCPKCGGQLISCDCEKIAIGVNDRWVEFEEDEEECGKFRRLKNDMQR